MKRAFHFFPVILFLLMLSSLKAQVDTKGVCQIDDGRILFRLDLRWTLAQRNQVAKQFDLDSMLMTEVYKGKEVITFKGVEWRVKKLDPNFIELSKPLDKPSGGKDINEDVFLIDDRWVEIESANERESVTFGVNKFTRTGIFHYVKGVVTLYLPGHTNARKVYLSGTFNSWSRMETPMNRTDSGWIATLALLPGKHAYKYIIDGKWTPDSFNRLKEDDQNGGSNSVFFCYNRSFRLRDHEKAHEVVLAGSFNGWNEQELRMIRINGVWLINLYLREGTHAYKFIVDGQWMNDPANKLTRPDGGGNKNSFISVGDTFYFRLSGFTDAKEVIVSGNFNVWNEKELSMEKVPGGWQLPYVLAPGNYEYKFIVDGKWMTDPSNPYKTGEGEYKSSLFVVKPNHTFTLNNYPNAKSVILSGSFNGWSRDGYLMLKKDGNWSYPISLKPGKYTYKFIVDGKWIIDPDNELWEGNEYGNANSVLWINP